MYILFILVPKLAQIFSGNSIFYRAYLVLTLWYFALTRKFIFGHRKMKLVLNFAGRQFTVYVESIVDLAALKEVFLLEEYNWMPTKNPKVIIDLGAHYGDTALYYHAKYPEAQIYAIEPAPDTFKRLVENTRDIENITAIQGGLGEHDGVATLHIVPSSLGNSLKQRTDSTNGVQVPIYTLQTILGMCNTTCADLIKFDIEGAEEFLFVSGEPNQFSHAYIGEVHTDLISITPETFIQHFQNFMIEKESLSNPKRFIIKAKSKNI